MRIVTWNIWGKNGLYERRAAAILSSIKELNPDIICFQEFCLDLTSQGKREFLHSFISLGYDKIALPKDTDNQCRIGILSKFPLLDTTEIYLETDPHEEHQRIALFAKVNAHRPLTLVTTHLDYRRWNGELRGRQLSNIVSSALSFSSTQPIILCGDFNATPNSEEIRRLRGEATPYVDATVFLDCWDFSEGGDGFTWLSSNPLTESIYHGNSRLDYIMINYVPDHEHIIVSNCHRFGFPSEDFWPSDHLGLVADIF